MTVAFDASTEASTFTTTSPFTFSHTPVGTPRSVVLMIDHGSVSTDLINGAVTYGGVAMTRHATAADTTTEPGRVYIYTLGENIPTGMQTVSISHTGSSDVKHAVVCTATAAADTEVGAAGSIDPETANPLVVLGNGDNSALAFGVFYSGDTNVGANATLLSGMTAIHDHDYGNFSSRCDRQTTAATGLFTFGYTIGVDDVALAAVSIIEKRTGAYAKGSTAPFLQNQTTSFILGMQGALNGMDLYCFVTSRDHTAGTALPTCTDNSGANTWTLLGNTSDRKALVFWKKGQTADIGALITVSGCVGSTTGGLLVIKGALSSGDPTTQLTFEDNASGNETHAGFTPTNAGSVVVFGVFDVANDTNAVTDLAGATMGSLEPEFWERLSTGGTDCRITVTARTLASGATGNFTWTQADSTTKSVSFAAQPEPSTVTLNSAGASESDSAGSATLTTAVILNVAGASETDAAGSATLTTAVILAASGATETDAAGSVTLLIPVSLDVAGASETDVAGAATLLIPVQIDSAGATETDAAGSLTLTTAVVLDVTGVLETDVAGTLTLTTAVVLDVSGAMESDSAGSAVLQTPVTLNASGASESDSAGTLTLTTTVILDVIGAVETDLSGSAVLTSDTIINASGASETDMAGSLTLTTAVVIDVSGAQETDLAGSTTLQTAVSLTVTGTQETDLAGSLTLTTAVFLNVAGGLETDLAGSAQLITAGLVILRSATSTVNSARASSTVRGLPVGSLVGAGSASSRRGAQADSAVGSGKVSSEV